MTISDRFYSFFNIIIISSETVIFNQLKPILINENAAIFLCRFMFFIFI